MNTSRHIDIYLYKAHLHKYVVVESYSYSYLYIRTTNGLWLKRPTLYRNWNLFQDSRNVTTQRKFKWRINDCFLVL